MSDSPELERILDVLKVDLTRWSEREISRGVDERHGKLIERYRREMSSLSRKNTVLMEALFREVRPQVVGLLQAFIDAKMAEEVEWDDDFEWPDDD